MKPITEQLTYECSENLYIQRNGSDVAILTMVRRPKGEAGSEDELTHAEFDALVTAVIDGLGLKFTGDK